MMNPDPDDVTFQFNQIQLLSSPKVVDDDDVSFGLNRVSSDSVALTPENSPANDDVADEDDDVTFGISQVETDSKRQQFTPENDDVDGAEADVEDEDDDVTFNARQVEISAKQPQFTPENDDVAGGGDNVEDEVDDVTFNVSQVQIVSKSPENDDVTFGSSQAETNTNEEADVADEGADVAEEEGDDVEDEEEEDDDSKEGEEFTFMCINPADSSITEPTEKTVFPLFDQSLLYSNSFNSDGKRINDIHVNNVFIESPRDGTSSSSLNTTTLTAITDSNEMNIKSNSTGFSKLWRFRDNINMNRSNSDGRDAFVFLNPKTEGKTEGKGKGKVVKEGEGKVAVVKKKVKKANVSAHEVYMKKAKGGGEEEKRKSYLPYRPGLMGFFTNVNGGLSKNVHPF